MDDLEAAGFDDKQLNKYDKKVCSKCYTNVTCNACMNFGRCMYAYTTRRSCLCNKCWDVHFGIQKKWNTIKAHCSSEEISAMEVYKMDGICVLSFGTTTWVYLEEEVEA